MGSNLLALLQKRDLDAKSQMDKRIIAKCRRLLTLLPISSNCSRDFFREFRNSLCKESSRRTPSQVSGQSLDFEIPHGACTENGFVADLIVDNDKKFGPKSCYEITTSNIISSSQRDSHKAQVMAGANQFLESQSPAFTIPSGIVTTQPSIIARIANDIPEIGVITTKSIGPVPRAGNREPIYSSTRPGHS